MSSYPDCIFEIYQLWQSGFSRVYSNCSFSCSFELEIIKIGQSSHKIYSNNIVNFQASTTILNVCTKKSGNLLKAPRIYSIYKMGCKKRYENRWEFLISKCLYQWRDKVSLFQIGFWTILVCLRWTLFWGFLFRIVWLLLIMVIYYIYIYIYVCVCVCLRGIFIKRVNFA